MNEAPARRQRVRALSPDERRAALVAATIPLLHEHGVGVTTRQIADAAGVAEGTIFGVFPDKVSLIRAAVVAAFDHAPLLEALQNIPPGADLRERLVLVVELLQKRAAATVPLLGFVRMAAIGSVGWPPPEVINARQQALNGIAQVIEPDRHRLRHPPEVVARLIQSMVMSSFRGFDSESDVLDARELVSLLLDGLLTEPRPATPVR